MPPGEETAAWGPTEWELFLESLPRPYGRCAELDAQYGLSAKTNYEVLVAWLLLALESGFEAVLPRVEEVLARVGRMKYLRPLYAAMAKRGGATRETAVRVFSRVRQSYHPIAQQVVEGILGATS